MGYDPNEPRNAQGEWTAAGGSAGSGKRWSQMGKREKARLNSSAQFKVQMSGGKAVGRKPRSEPDYAFGPSIENRSAVVIQTARALDRDFHDARDKVAHADMAAAIARHQGKITKYPAGKRKK